MNVLLLDPDPEASRPLRALLEEGAALTHARVQGEGLRRLAAGGWDLVLLDLEFSGAGLELLPRLHEQGGAPIALLAAEPSLELTLEAIRLGAFDVLGKPLAAERVRELLASACTARRVRRLPDGPPRGDALIGTGEEMLSVFKAVARAARSDATVLVIGESGTGKEMVARVLHAQSPRARGPFVAINCAAIPENLLESELFGHEKGSFTGAVGRRIGRFERADGGTLFLDEIGDMSLALQSKILRALQEREIERVGGSGAVRVDTRVVAATNRDLPAAVAAGTFREDLFYRLAVVTLRLPPLRARGADLDLLAEHFAALFARQHGRPVAGIAEETLQALRRHPWPGNVRQLRNALERAVVMADGEVLLPRHLPPEILDAGPDPAPSAPAAPEPLCTLAEMERRMIDRAVRESGHNYSVAAELLGIHRNTLRRKIQEYGLDGA